MVAVDQSENGSSYYSDDDDESLSDEDDSFDSSNVDSGEDQSKHSNNDKTEIYDIAQEDAHKLRTWRAIIIVVLLISFVGTTSAVVALLRHEAQEDEVFVVRTTIFWIFYSTNRHLCLQRVRYFCRLYFQIY